jgi:hypothetical protein
MASAAPRKILKLFQRGIPTRRLKGIGFTAIFWLVLCANSAAFQASHELTVVIDPDSGALSGTDRILLSDCPQDVLPIGLHPRIRIQSLQVNGRPRAVVTRDSGLAVDLSGADRGMPIELTLHYDGRFQDEAPVLPVNTDNPGYGVTGTISPRGTLLLGGAGWYPAIDGAVETLQVRVEAPEGWTAVTAGRSTGVATMNGRTVSSWQVDPPAERLALSVGRYITTTSQAGTIETATYLLSDDPRLAATYLKATAVYLSRYENQFGPYPFPKFAIVENFFPTGYVFPS